MYVMSDIDFSYSNIAYIYRIYRTVSEYCLYEFYSQCERSEKSISPTKKVSRSVYVCSMII